VLYRKSTKALVDFLYDERWQAIAVGNIAY
jgi:hypothetical protein